MFKSRINGIVRASQRAINQFTRVQSKLAAHNDKLSLTIQSINDELITLNEHRLAAEAVRRQNAGVIQRIDSLVNGH